MFGSAVLDTAIGMILVFFVTSTISSNIYSLISRWSNSRGKLLQSSLIKLLGKEVYEQVMNHPRIRDNHVTKKFWSGELVYETIPDYIDPEVFSQVLAEIIEKAGNSSDLTRMLPEKLTSPVEYFLEQVQQKGESVERLARDIQEWYDQRMWGLKEIFKNQAQLWVGVISVGVVLFFNINTITVAQSLWYGPTLRDTVVASAEQQVAANVEANENPEDSVDRTAQEIFQDDLLALDLPVGWTEQELDALKIIPTGLAQVNDSNRVVPSAFTFIAGLLATMGAAMFGAPFWYDLLKNITNLRSSNN